MHERTPSNQTLPYQWVALEGKEGGQRAYLGKSELDLSCPFWAMFSIEPDLYRLTE